MGDFNVRPIRSEQERTDFYKAIFQDLRAFERMLHEGLIEQKSDTIGAEQEICLVDPSGCPKPTALQILDRIQDERYTNELALYNLEANLSPQPLHGDCFRRVADELSDCLQIGQAAAQAEDSRLLLTGNLPTLNFRHLRFDFMTPEERYRLLSNELLKLRGRNFEIYLQGVDDLHTSLDSVLFEACNTSFQLHLQIDPREFVALHNWSQMISGPVLAMGTNSPLLFGKELWAENRIALFKQSLDTRGHHNHGRVHLSRVYFGNRWLEKSPLELWKTDVVRFPVLLRGFGESDPMEALDQGIIPKLKSIRLHNGTTYTWNRLCYGVHQNSPHIRIECRYLPSGPTPVDEIANFAFWIGLMKAYPEGESPFWEFMDFRLVKDNFIRAARYGMHSVLHWFGKNYPVKELVLEHLLPMARQGLERMQILPADVDRYLGVIEQRALAEQTGSIWQQQAFRELNRRFKPALSTRLLVQQMLEYQEADLPVHAWPPLQLPASHTVALPLHGEPLYVEDIMTQEVITIRENVSLEAIRQIFEWRQFHHVLVESPEGKLEGIISDKLLAQYDGEEALLAKDIMIRKVITTSPEASIQEAQALMDQQHIHCLPVIENEKIIGIITDRDLPGRKR